MKELSLIQFECKMIEFVEHSLSTFTIQVEW